MIDQSEITGVVLAGGRARRMGGVDKGLIPLHGRPMVAHALAVLRSIAGRVVLSANRNLKRYTEFGVPVIPDASDTFDGPLAGLLAGLLAAETPYVLAMPVDAPLMTAPVLLRLVKTLEGRQVDVCIPSDGERLHPVFTCIRRALAPELRRYLADGGRKVDVWVLGQAHAISDCRDVRGVFANVNCPDDLRRLEGEIPESLPR